MQLRIKTGDRVGSNTINAVCYEGNVHNAVAAPHASNNTRGSKKHGTTEHVPTCPNPTQRYPDTFTKAQATKPKNCIQTMLRNRKDKVKSYKKLRRRRPGHVTGTVFTVQEGKQNLTCSNLT